MRELKTTLSHSGGRVSACCALLFVIALLNIPAAGIPRIVQTATAQTPDRVCDTTSCTSSPDQLTISFSPTLAGDALALLYVGNFNDFGNLISAPFYRTCTDSSGQIWTPVVLGGSFLGQNMYFPPAGSTNKGLTSITCSGLITNGLFPGAIPGNGGVSTLQFFELGGVSSTPVLLGGGDNGTNPATVDCGSHPPGGFDLFLLAGMGNLLSSQAFLTFTPESPDIRPLTTVTAHFVGEFSPPVAGVTAAATFYGIDGVPSVFDLTFNSTNADAWCWVAQFQPVPDLVDPIVPGLVQNMAVIPATDDNAELLATQGRVVQGVAADGVAQLLLRIPAASPGDQITVTLLDENQQPPQTNEYGALGLPGDTSPTIANNQQNQITATALSTKEGTVAFAIYVAPTDFPRASGQDASSTQRQVFIKAQMPDGTSLPPIPVTIVRPLLVMIHGLWGNGTTWDAFDGSFFFPTERVNYSEFAPLIASSVPDYGVGWKASANSLGFGYNAPRVLQRIEAKIKAFKQGNYPNGIPVAAIQADVLAHSMGGDITRMLPSWEIFLQAAEDLGQGVVHKVITIDTPHQGSPLATALLLPENKCVRNLLGRIGFYSFDSVTFFPSDGGGTVSGAVGDLTPQRTTLLLNTSNTGRSLKIALIAGTEDAGNLSGLDTNWLPQLIHSFCGSSPLGASFTAAQWPSIFGEDSDGIVGLTSQLNGLGTSAGSVPFTGRIHGQGTTGMGLNPPTMTDTVVAQKVLELLNTPVSNSVFNTIP